MVLSTCETVLPTVFVTVSLTLLPSWPLLLESEPPPPDEPLDGADADLPPPAPAGLDGAPVGSEPLPEPEPGVGLPAGGLPADGAVATEASLPSPPG
jgi:hypothetical protein